MNESQDTRDDVRNAIATQQDNKNDHSKSETELKKELETLEIESKGVEAMKWNGKTKAEELADEYRPFSVEQCKFLLHFHHTFYSNTKSNRDTDNSTDNIVCESNRNGTLNQQPLNNDNDSDSGSDNDCSMRTLHSIVSTFDDPTVTPPPARLLNALQFIESRVLNCTHNNENDDTFARRLLECAFRHSIVLEARSKGGDDGPFSTALFMEALMGLSGRRGGPTFEMRVLYSFFQNDNDKDDQVAARDLIQLLYRLALSCHILQHWPQTPKESSSSFSTDCTTQLNTESPKQEGGIHHIENTQTQRTQSNKHTLNLDTITRLAQNDPPPAMVASLLSHKHNHNQHIYSDPSSTMYEKQDTTNPDGSINGIKEQSTKEEEEEGGGGGGGVDLPTFRDWVESSFPQMAGILSSFLHLALFSWQMKRHPSKTQMQTRTAPPNQSNAKLQRNVLLNEEKKDDDPKWVSDPSASHFTDDANDSTVRHVTTTSSHSDSDSDNSSDSDEKQDETYREYCQGTRTIFQFPVLEKVAPHSFQNGGRGPIFSCATTSACFGNGGGDGGVGIGEIGHAAFGMACMEPNLCGKWYNLYSTETDGFSFLQLQRALTGYTGPTILTIRPTTETTDFGGTSNDGKDASSPGLFGFYTTNAWHESKQFYGSSDCFLYRAEPSMDVYRPQQLDFSTRGDIHAQTHTQMHATRRSKKSDNYMYFHTSPTNHSTIQQQQRQQQQYYSQRTNYYNTYTNNRTRTSTKPRGLILGGTEEKPRFHLTESLEQCIASTGILEDGTYRPGPLLPCCPTHHPHSSSSSASSSSFCFAKYFNVDVLEVWGVGGETVVQDSLLARRQKVDVMDATRKRFQVVDKHKFLQDFQQGRFVGGGNKLFEHRNSDEIRYDFEKNGGLR